MYKTIKIAIAIGVFAPIAAAASDNKLNSSDYMVEYGKTLPPIGHVYFCAARPEECGRQAASPALAKLDRAAWTDLNHVNRAVNARIAPATDQALYATPEHWTYPVGAGDCEDYVLLKQAMLIDRGWPTGALLITVVRDRAGDGHAVLTVSTDRGDLVLDNTTDNVVRWRETGYTFLKRQSRTHAARWVALNRQTAASRSRLFSGLGG